MVKQEAKLLNLGGDIYADWESTTKINWIHTSNIRNISMISVSSSKTVTSLPSLQHFGIQSVELRPMCRGHLRWLQATLCVSSFERQASIAHCGHLADWKWKSFHPYCLSRLCSPYGFERDTDARTDLGLELQSYDDLNSWACAT